MSLVRFPPGEPVFADEPWEQGQFAKVDQLLGQGYCKEGWFQLESKDRRLICLIHMSKPYLAGLVSRDGYSWMPLRELPERARQLEQARCSLYHGDLVQVLLMAVHFRNKPKLHASTNLVNLAHVITVLSAEGHDAGVALERDGSRTLLFLQKGQPTRIYFGDGQPGSFEGTVTDRFLRYGFGPGVPISQLEVFNRLSIEADPDAGRSLSELAKAAKEPPPTSVQIIRGDDMVLHRSFMPPTMTVGRDQTCELRLDNLTVSWRHARLIWQNGRFEIEDLGSSNGTRVNGRPIQRQVIGTGDKVGIGAYELALVDSVQVKDRAKTVMFTPGSVDTKLFLAGEGVSIPLDREVTIGRVEGVDLRIRGLRVKPIHARIAPTGGGGVRLTCVGKSKVVYKGQKTRQVALDDGDELVLGGRKLRVVAVPDYQISHF